MSSTTGAGPAVNEALRSHVTRVGFDLTLGKTHIASLVYLDACLRQRTILSLDSSRTPFQWMVTGMHGLIDRGLVTHDYAGRPRKGQVDHMGRHYTITKAGRLVRSLLREAGIWQEYEAAMPIKERAAS